MFKIKLGPAQLVGTILAQRWESNPELRERFDGSIEAYASFVTTSVDMALAKKENITL